MRQAIQRGSSSSFIIGVLLAAGIFGSVVARPFLNRAAPQKTRSFVFLSEAFPVDRIYRSMEGPLSRGTILLESSPKPELLWLTGMKTEIVGEDGKTPVSDEFICHVNLDIEMMPHSERFALKRESDNRLLTLSQGVLEARFPEGFGYPVMSDEPLAIAAQAVNLNHPELRAIFRHRVTLTFIRDSDLTAPLTPLFTVHGIGQKLVSGDAAYFGIEKPDAAQHGEGCLPGETAPNARGRGNITDSLGRTFSVHWVVKPGREINHTNITVEMNLPFDTIMHFANVHVHPFAESLELYDQTAKQALFKSSAVGRAVGVGLGHVDDFSSAAGVPLYKDHQYSLISTYNNTSGVDQDSMAVMNLYLEDKEFSRSASAQNGPPHGKAPGS